MSEFDHENIEKERLAHEQERLTRHVVAPGARADFERESLEGSRKAQAVEDAKLRAVVERKAGLPRFDPANKDAPGGFKMLDSFEILTLVTQEHNQLVAAFNEGRVNDIFALFTKTGGLVGVGGKEFTGKADITAYFQRLRDSGVKNLKHTPANYKLDDDHTITEWGSGYLHSSGSGTYSVHWRRIGSEWRIAKLTYNS